MGGRWEGPGPGMGGPGPGPEAGQVSAGRPAGRPGPRVPDAWRRSARVSTPSGVFGHLPPCPGGAWDPFYSILGLLGCPESIPK